MTGDKQPGNFVIPKGDRWSMNTIGVNFSERYHPAGILEYKWFFYVILYVIILFDIEIDIKIRFILFVETVFLCDFLCYI
jgi:hypothetical protein